MAEMILKFVSGAAIQLFCCFLGATVFALPVYLGWNFGLAPALGLHLIGLGGAWHFALGTLTLGTVVKGITLTLS